MTIILLFQKLILSSAYSCPAVRRVCTSLKSKTVQTLQNHGEPAGSPGPASGSGLKPHSGILQIDLGVHIHLQSLLGYKRCLAQQVTGAHVTREL